MDATRRLQFILHAVCWLHSMMFLLYYNDLQNILQSTIVLFVDDCLLYIEISITTDPHLLQDLNQLTE